MTGNADGGFDLDDNDRLPWLEPADDMADRREPSGARILGLVVVGLLLLGLIVGGGYWLRMHGRDSAGDDATLIAAPGGDYKIRADTASGKNFDGTGDTSYATSEGVDTNGRVDASRVPEAPMPGISRGSIRKEDGAKPAASSKPATQVTAAVSDRTDNSGRPATSAVTGAGGAMIQLGAYNSDAVARDAWTKLSKRFTYLASLSNGIERAEVGGVTVYRLRAAAGSAANASTLCGRLKVAGENCLVVR